MSKITIQTTVHAPIEKVWEFWNAPEKIKRWAFASDDWEATDVENDLKVGGNFRTHMQAKDKSMGFDFAGTYTNVVDLKVIEYDLGDVRKVAINFESVAPNQTKITQTFDAETENTEEKQRDGWQAILDNFKKCVEHE